MSFSLLALDGEGATLLLLPPFDTAKIRTKVMKPYIDRADNSKRHAPTLIEYIALQFPSSAITYCNFGIALLQVSASDIDNSGNRRIEPPSWKKVIFRSEDNNNPSYLLAKDLDRQVNFRVFILVSESKSDGHGIYNLRFVDELQQAGSPDTFWKSQLDMQAFNDNENGLLNNALTMNC